MTARKFHETDDVFKIFNEHVLPNLFDPWKYCPLPMEKNSKKWKWEGKDLPRVISVLEFAEFLKFHNLSFEKVLCINGDSDPEYEYISYGDRRLVNFEDDCVNHDLHRLNLSETDYDFCMLNQTLEHLYDPAAAISSIYNHLRPTGIVYLSVPVVNLPHGTPFHFYTGITSMGLGTLLEEGRFEIMNIGQWGNKEYIKAMFETYNWPDYRQLSNPGYNDHDHPVVSWAWARKPGEIL